MQIHCTSRYRPALLALLVTLLVVAGASCREPGAAGTGAQEPDDLVPLPDKGVVEGVVMDREESLPEGATSQTYQGASILVYEAVESGTYRVAAGQPERTSYEPGEKVAELTSAEDGYWRIDLEPGTYFVRAFYGPSSYSEEILVEVERGSATHVDLELIHGV